LVVIYFVINDIFIFIQRNSINLLNKKTLLSNHKNIKKKEANPLKLDSKKKRLVNLKLFKKK